MTGCEGRHDEHSRRRQLTTPRVRLSARLSSLPADIDVAGTPNGFQHLRFFRIRLDFPPDARHSNIDAPVENIALALVCELQQLASAQDAVGMRGEGVEQIELKVPAGARVDQSSVIL